MRPYNNLTELRFFFAFAVLLAHSFQLSSNESGLFFRTIFSSERAVQAFFMLSGFLVLGSYERCAGLRDFYLRRALRIYPAYVLAVLIFLGLGLAQAGWLGATIAWGDVPRYLAANLVLLNFLQDTVGGVFASNPYPHINGALWTIKIEVGFYLLVPVIFHLGRRTSFLWTALLIITGGLLWRPLLLTLAARFGLNPHPALLHQLPGQLHFFGLGVLFFHYSRSPGRLGQTLSALLGIAALACVTAQAGTALNMLVLSGLIVAAILSPPLPSPLGKLDLSYGIYLCHFPLIQLLVATGWLGSVPLITALVAVLAFGYAWLSWTLVEHPLLEMRKRHEARH